MKVQTISQNDFIALVKEQLTKGFRIEIERGDKYFASMPKIFTFKPGELQTTLTVYETNNFNQEILTDNPWESGYVAIKLNVPILLDNNDPTRRTEIHYLEVIRDNNIISLESAEA